MPIQTRSALELGGRMYANAAPRVTRVLLCTYSRRFVSLVHTNFSGAGPR